MTRPLEAGRWEFWVEMILITWLGGGNSNMFYFHPYLGKWSNLTNIFQMGWNHQLDDFHVTHENRFEWILCLKEWKWNAKTGSFMLLHTKIHVRVLWKTTNFHPFSASLFFLLADKIHESTKNRDQSRTNWRCFLPFLHHGSVSKGLPQIVIHSDSGVCDECPFSRNLFLHSPLFLGLCS